MSENPHSEWHSDDELASSLEDVMGRLGKVEAAADASDTGRVELLEQAAAQAAVEVEPIVESYGAPGTAPVFESVTEAPVAAPVFEPVTEAPVAAPVFEPATAAPVASYSNEDSAEVTAIIESYIDDDDDDDGDPTDAFAAYYADTAAVTGVVNTEAVVPEVVTPQQDAPPAPTFAPDGYVPGQTDEVVVTTSTTSTMFHVSDTRYEKPKRATFDEVFFGRSSAPAATPER